MLRLARLVSPAFALLTVLACGGKATIDAGAGAAGGGGSTPTSCEGLGHASCLAAYPSCVPLYDDACCPTCDPGPCADCIDWQFQACVPAASACAPAAPPCGQTPAWACSGGTASCPQGYCQSTAGCLYATCPVGVGCVEACHPATAGMCTATCLADPMPCPPGQTPEADGLCYTGFCIPSDTCL